MGNFLKSILGSYVKAFVAIVLAYVISAGSVWEIDWKDLLSASLISFAPMVIKAITGSTDGFWNTVYGGLVKTFLTVAIAYIVQNGSIYGLDWRELVNTVIMALSTVFINGLNPADERYGVNKEE